MKERKKKVDIKELWGVVPYVNSNWENHDDSFMVRFALDKKWKAAKLLGTPKLIESQHIRNTFEWFSFWRSILLIID